MGNKSIENAVMNALEDGVIVLNEQREPEFFNEKALSLLKISTAGELDYVLPVFLGNFDPKLFLSSATPAVRQKRIFEGEALIVSALRMPGKETEKILLVFNRLAHYKDTLPLFDDETVTASLLNTVMDAVNDCLIFVNNDGRIEMLSKAYADFLNVPREEAIGKHVRQIIENTRMDIVTKTGKAEIAQVQEIHGRKMIATRIPVFVGGKVAGAVGKVLFRDVDELNALYTKINKIEKELNLYRDEFKKANKAKYALDSIIGDSAVMVQLKEITKKVANTNSNVLILGESGTGKELFAHAIHNNSKRSGAPFIKVNCGAIPNELLESELFGYEEGAFTGAKKGGKIGKFKVADTGTIFLDEIADLPMNMQVKLLRVLQDREIERIGATTSEKVDVRVIAATNKSLEDMVSEGLFRLDLYYRLNVVNIRIPPLRERKNDIPILAQHLIEKISKNENVPVKAISQSTLEYLKSYEWPGNVRELENILERAINFLEDEVIIEPKHLPAKITGTKNMEFTRSLKETLENVEKDTIINSLILSGGNKTEAADLLGISRTSLYEKLTRYKIEI
jgi:transcriptional regulator with PAS, ATPase and Fis domain